MRRYHLDGFVTICIVMFFLVSSVSSGAVGITQTAQQESSIKTTVSAKNEVMVSCVAGGIRIQKHISVEACESVQQLFSAVIQANAVDPCSENTQMLKLRFIQSLVDLGLIDHDSSTEEEICKLIEPPWSQKTLSKRWGRLMPPRPLDDEDNATLFLCSMAGAGWGFVIPPVLLPRPRLLMQWRGFYPDSSAVSVAEMATGRGVIARGTQIGTAFGFFGVGFAFALPGAPAQFGFLGYSLMTRLQAADMTWYYANFPPLVMEVSPEDGAIEVPVSLSELRFTLKDYDFDKMTYSVVTSPDIGSGSDANVGNGEYSIPVSNLDGGTMYTWTVTVSDGTDTVEEVFSFTTEAVAPVISNPFPKNNALFVPIETSELSFDLMDYQGDLMDWTVETKPNIGSGSGSNVNNGRYGVVISGLEYFTNYTWYVNVTDGAYWTRRAFVFRTTSQGTLVFEPNDDTGVQHSSPNVNFGDALDVTIRNEYGAGSGSGYAWDGLIYFDISALPTNASIRYAYLQMYYYAWKDTNPAGRTLRLYPVTSIWEEEIVTWNTQPTYAPQSTSSAIVPASTGVWMEWDVTADVQVFCSGTSLNYGWKITDDTPWNNANIPIVRLYAKEFGDFIPILIIGYDT